MMTHRFWNNPLVPQKNISESNYGIVSNVSIEDFSSQPLKLPPGFEWTTLDVNDQSQLKEMQDMLHENYVKDNKFSLFYSKELIQWLLTPPGYIKEWHIGVRTSNNGLLVGIITGVPVTLIIEGAEVKSVQINFLCVHSKLRGKRMTPILIREITRLVGRTGDYHAACHTSGTLLPNSVGWAQYHHRLLNVRKLVETGFHNQKITLSMANKLYSVPSQVSIQGLRLLRSEDIQQAVGLLSQHLSKFAISQKMSLTEAQHLLLPREGVVYTYVTPTVKDLVSFYILPSSVSNNSKHSLINTAYIQHVVATSVSPVELMSNALTLAKQLGIDVMNCLDIMDSQNFRDELKFLKGSGGVYYYLHNWKLGKDSHFLPHQIGMVIP